MISEINCLRQNNYYSQEFNRKTYIDYGRQISTD